MSDSQILDLLERMCAEQPHKRLCFVLARVKREIKTSELRGPRKRRWFSWIRRR